MASHFPSFHLAQVQGSQRAKRLRGGQQVAQAGEKLRKVF
jgi:hypothetical protein